MRVATLIYGLTCYLSFLGIFLYAVGFVTGAVVPKTIDDGVATPASLAVMINVGLLTLFGVQHSIMARPAFKRWWTRIVPPSVERSTFVLATFVVLSLIFWQWRPLPTPVWSVQNPVASGVLFAVGIAGWLIVLVSTFLIDHFELFGLRQTWLGFRGRPYSKPVFKERLFYRMVRHPLMLGFLVAFFAAPTVSQGRLLFALVTTAYVLVAIQLEERDLLAEHGESYDRYRRRVPMLLPRPGGSDS
jgi:protein-S-isoprenylcysteine O-methyltransferase Ste14